MLRTRNRASTTREKHLKLVVDYHLKDEAGRYVYTVKELAEKYGYAHYTVVYPILRRYRRWKEEE